MKRSIVLAIVAVAMSGLTIGADELDQHGNAHAWSGPSDGYTIIDFAAAWCRPCWTVLPRLEEYAAAHPEIRVLVVAVDDDVKGRNALVEKLKLTIPVIWDEKHRIAELYKPVGMPATYVLDRDGKVVHSHSGSGDKEWDAMVTFLNEATKRR